ncbi:hypothetical protein TBLA_0A00350 [Henningerozyma blattae CBS 6284]|uniref:C2H2-type domain-containing protein n=1 Tax=Henningerozyma blattae (strain ATCC 34711 / CBS 6284 / DSM 70876 / NBRC 10599 / NRRL Y-10934 / UCD 77-7) TaxID=1071380 RepID=I2GUN3_HENB6|nr:hypothetical protein TBLA_0A00350 [Tetrapisispora blattae CBS 6284]CCH57835.1 hypothetical protein TBLA_0A00350 [Tetrapisispora blattae CBS 6284]
MDEDDVFFQRATDALLQTSMLKKEDMDPIVWELYSRIKHKVNSDNSGIFIDELSKPKDITKIQHLNGNIRTNENLFVEKSYSTGKDPHSKDNNHGTTMNSRKSIPRQKVKDELDLKLENLDFTSTDNNFAINSRLHNRLQKISFARNTETTNVSSSPTVATTAATFSALAPSSVSTTFTNYGIRKNSFSIARRSSILSAASTGASTDEENNTAPEDNNNLEQRKYRCNECFLTFKRSSDVRRHERTHLTVVPHICKECGKGFARKDALKRHANTLTCKRNRNKLLSLSEGLNELLRIARHSANGDIHGERF